MAPRSHHKLPLPPAPIPGIEAVRAMPYGLKGCIAFCRLLKTEEGKPLRLEPFQREILADFFAGVVEILIILPTGNGKTTLLSALALYHILMIRDAEAVIGAASRDQATVLFRQAEKMVERSGLETVFDVKGGYRHIRCGGSRLRVMASGADTGDGIIPTLALVDELHRHPSGALYSVFRFKIVKRHGQMLTISTAGATMASPLGQLRAAAYRLRNFRRDEAKKHVVARSDDRSFVMHEWCLDLGDDPKDMRLVAKANPASWKTIKELLALHSTPSMTAWEWLRFACGIWTEGEEPGIPPEVWDPLGVEGLEIPVGAEVTMGIDLTPNHAGAGVSLVMADGDGYRAKVYLLTGRGEETVPLARVEAKVRELAEVYNVWQIVHDTLGFGRSAEMLRDEGYPIEEHPQSNERMILASGAFYKLMEEGRLHHDGDPALRAQAMAVRVKTMERGWRYQKDPSSPQSVDGLFALMVACYIADMANQGEPQVMVF